MSQINNILFVELIIIFSKFHVPIKVSCYKLHEWSVDKITEHFESNIDNTCFWSWNIINIFFSTCDHQNCMLQIASSVSWQNVWAFESIDNNLIFISCIYSYVTFSCILIQRKVPSLYCFFRWGINPKWSCVFLGI